MTLVARNQFSLYLSFSIAEAMKELNDLEDHKFIALFESVVEFTPEIGTFLNKHRPFQTVDSIIETVSNFLDQQTPEKQSEILHQYPDLAGRFATQNQLSVESTNEHAAGGLFNLSPQDHHLISELNAKYRDAFGFPFVICVRLSNFEMIISEMKKRCQNTAADELSNGIEEVKKIAALRIHDICSKVESCNQ